MRDISRMGQWDADEGFHYIATEEFGLPRASVADDSEATALLGEWCRGLLELDAPEDIPLSDISASIQGVLRRDVLEFYIAGSDRTYDDAPSSWGALGPLAVQLRDGRVVLIDGNHRWATGRIRNERSFRAQILRRR